MNESPLMRALRETEIPGAFVSPWRIWEALAVVALFAVSQPAVSLAASMLLTPLLGGDLSHQALEARLYPIVLPLVILISHLVGWTALFWLIVRRHRVGLLTGLRLRRRDLRDHPRARLMRTFLGGMGLQVLGVVLIGFASPPENLESPILRFVSTGGWTVPVLVLMAVVMAPPLEEALFRGVLLPALRRRMSFIPAALLTTALFTALHAVQTSGYWPALLAIGVAGYVMAWLRERSGALWQPILFHMGFNFTAMVPLLFIPQEALRQWPG